MLNFYYKDTIDVFLKKPSDQIIGEITTANQFDAIRSQNKAWRQQIVILKEVLVGFQGVIFFEFSIPRMGKRLDCILLINNVVFVAEFKVGETKFLQHYIEQVWDYALDLKNFHQPSHNLPIVPVLICTEAPEGPIGIITTSHGDDLCSPLKVNKFNIGQALRKALVHFDGKPVINTVIFETGSYSPTPNIIEAAISLYNNHSVDNITRNDADAENLTVTTSTISGIIEEAKANSKKIICFVTGVPGAGKTLVGLKVATTYANSTDGNSSVYLSGNAPLVAILTEALSRDKVARDLAAGKRTNKKEARQSVSSFIQIIHHYRDAYIVDKSAPYDHVAIFDEAQRVWNKEHTVKFMQQKKNLADFEYSEPEFLISCLDRHKDWAVIICLVGEGQEINTGEAGISEWLKAINDKFSSWEVYISPMLQDAQYSSTDVIHLLEKRTSVNFKSELHLSVSLRSFRAENLSAFVKHLLDLDISKAKKISEESLRNYPILLTRDLNKAKYWLREKARGSERYGLIVSSQAQRLKPFAIDVKSPINPVNWFLDGKDDVRSSYYLEDVATEFHVQGLELDWVCLAWDGDLRYSSTGWKMYSFKGSTWKNIHNLERRKYLINSYRVLLTRARQGLIIVVPEGNDNDHTRLPEYYDSTFRYLSEMGLNVV